MDTRRSKRISVFIAAPLVVVLAFVLVPAGPASAAGPLACVATGKVETTPGVVGPDGQTYDWAVKGTGLCTGNFGGPYTLTFAGQGRSTMLGLCDNLIVRDLAIGVRMHTVSLKTDVERDFDEVWTAPLTTYPLATPFLVTTTDGSLLGAGGFETRIGLKCAPDGRPVAIFEWAQLQS